MKSFKQFLFESKAESYANQWMKVHADHPLVQSNPEEARKLIGHARSFAQHPDEHHYLTRQLLDRTYKPEEDDSTIRMTLGKIRRARNRGIDIGDIKKHTHDTISDAFSKHFGLDLTQKQSRGMSGLERFHIGKIQHPEHGELDVHHIHKNDIEDDAEYENISSNLRKTCSGSSWCVLPKESGATHLKHYAHGHGIFFYSKNGVPVLSHGFGDRGIVKPDNSVIDTSRAENIINQTSVLLSGNKKEVYDFFNGKDQKPTLEKQHRMYDELGDKHGAAQFADPKIDTHPEILSKLLSHSDHYVRHEALGHPNITENHIEQALNDSHEHIRWRAISHGKATSKHISKALLNKDHTLRELAIRNPNATKDHISLALSDENYNIRRAALKHSNVTEKHIERGLMDSMGEVQAQAIAHPKATSRNITQALSNSNKHVRRIAAQHPNANYEHIMQALGDSTIGVRQAAISHPNATEAHITQALKDLDPDVREAAMGHPNTTVAHITSALKDSSDKVREAAIAHPNATEDQLTQILSKNSEFHDRGHDSYSRRQLRLAAARNPNLTKDHISLALSDNYYLVRRLAFNRQNLTDDHIEQALKDDDPGIRASAEDIKYLRQLQSKANKVTESLNYTIIKILSQK